MNIVKTFLKSEYKALADEGKDNHNYKQQIRNESLIFGQNKIENSGANYQGEEGGKMISTESVGRIVQFRTC